jgi:hypothetical protein
MSEPTYLYHCSHESDLATRRLKPFEHGDREIRGLCFSDAPQEQYGAHVYRAELPHGWSLLTDSLLFNLQVSAEDQIDWAVDRQGRPLTITRQDVRDACSRAMEVVGIDEDLFDAVYNCAIEDAGCQEDEELEEAGVSGWDLQSVRALSAHYLGLWGAVIEDDTGEAYISADHAQLLDKVVFDEDHAQADACGYVVAQPNWRRAVLQDEQTETYGASL